MPLIRQRVKRRYGSLFISLKICFIVFLRGILRALGVLGFVIWVSNRTPCCIGFQIGRRAFWAVDIFEVLLYLIFCVTLIFLTIYPTSLSLLCRVYEGIIRKGDFIVNVNTGKKIKVRFR